MNRSTGLTSIEEVRSTFAEMYNRTHRMVKIELKCWKGHSESRHRNNHAPFTFNNYTAHMRKSDYIEQVNLNMIDCVDLDGKDEVLAYLAMR
jgi:hypothetical protein